jgi:hypothetical protein
MTTVLSGVLTIKTVSNMLGASEYSICERSKSKVLTVSRRYRYRYVLGSWQTLALKMLIGTYFCSDSIVRHPADVSAKESTALIMRKYEVHLAACHSESQAVWKFWIYAVFYLLFYHALNMM